MLNSLELPVIFYTNIKFNFSFGLSMINKLGRKLHIRFNYEKSEVKRNLVTKSQTSQQENHISHNKTHASTTLLLSSASNNFHGDNLRLIERKIDGGGLLFGLNKDASERIPYVQKRSCGRTCGMITCLHMPNAAPRIPRAFLN